MHLCYQNKIPCVTCDQERAFRKSDGLSVTNGSGCVTVISIRCLNFLQDLLSESHVICLLCLSNEEKKCFILCFCKHIN